MCYSARTSASFLRVLPYAMALLMASICCISTRRDFSVSKSPVTRCASTSDASKPETRHEKVSKQAHA